MTLHNAAYLYSDQFNMMLGIRRDWTLRMHALRSFEFSGPCTFTLGGWEIIK